MDGRLDGRLLEGNSLSVLSDNHFIFSPSSAALQDNNVDRFRTSELLCSALAARAFDTFTRRWGRRKAQQDGERDREREREREREQ